METLLLFNFYLVELLSVIGIAVFIGLLIVLIQRINGNRRRIYELEDEIYRDSGIDER